MAAVVVVGLLEGAPEELHRGGEVRELLQMLRREPLKRLGAPWRERKPNDAVAIRIGAAPHQTGDLGAVHELNRAVVAQ